MLSALAAIETISVDTHVLANLAADGIVAKLALVSLKAADISKSGGTAVASPGKVGSVGIGFGKALAAIVAGWDTGLV